jgi:hypothetical protein
VGRGNLHNAPFLRVPREDTDRGGRNRAGLVPEDSFDRCYDRAIAAIEGTKLSDPGMGMEWRLMPVGDNKSPPTAATSDPGTYREDDRDLSMYHVGAVDTDRGLSYGTRSVLSNAGLLWIDELDAMSDRDLVRVRGIGNKRLTEVRRMLDAYYWRGSARRARSSGRGASLLRMILENAYLDDRALVFSRGSGSLIVFWSGTERRCRIGARRGRRRRECLIPPERGTVASPAGEIPPYSGVPFRP